MVQLTRIYTRGGDKGKTSLGDGSRVFKDDFRLEAIGDVDEANATLGLIVLSLEKTFQNEHLLFLRSLQNDLFDVGADLCYPNPPDLSKGPALQIKEAHIIEIEKIIDEMNTQLEPLTSFVLPGGTEVSTACHIARTVVRRAERSVVGLSHRKAYVNPRIIEYLNRLSDFLFVMGRFYNEKGKKDVLWKPGGSK